MPKAKPKVPKTEKMWMAWFESCGFIWGMKSKTKKELLRKFMETPLATKGFKPVPVRIMPEAEYQRLRKAKKGGK